MKEMISGKGKPGEAGDGGDHFGSENDARSEPRRSNSATIETSDVSLNSEMKLLTRFGMTWRSACGSTISEVVFHQDSPNAAAASPCPRGIAASPPRTFSA